MCQVTPIPQVFRALLASKLDFDAMLIFADVLEEHGHDLRLGFGVSARELAAAYRKAADEKWKPKQNDYVTWFDKRFTWHDVAGVIGSQKSPYGNRHRAFLRLARALRECEKAKEKQT